MFTAIQMSSDFEKSGFSTKDEAWDFIDQQMCDSCQRALKEFNEGNSKYRETHCDAEWDVLLTSEWEEIKRECDEQNFSPELPGNE
jgi:hypothetical protein